MSSYSPPTSNLAIFTKSTFIAPTTALTQQQADSRYVQYPLSQGSETITQNFTVMCTTILSGLAEDTHPIYLTSDDSTIATTAFVKGQEYATAASLADNFTLLNNNINAQVEDLQTQIDADVALINQTFAQVILTESTDVLALNNLVRDVSDNLLIQSEKENADVLYYRLVFKCSL